MTKRIISIIGIIISTTLLIAGLLTSVPQKEISYYSSDKNGYKNYVGGEAYNIQIEASLRGGMIAGAKVVKAIYISSASIVFIISLPGCFSIELACKKEEHTETTCA